MSEDNVINFKSRRDRHMNTLVSKIGAAMEGEKNQDCMIAAAAIIGYMLNEEPLSRREYKMSAVFKFIRRLADAP